MNPTIATKPPATWTLVAPLVGAAEAAAADAPLDTAEATDEAAPEVAAAARTEVVIVAWVEDDDIMELETMDEEEVEDDTSVVEFDDVEDEVVEFPPETSMPVPQGMDAPVPGWVELVGSVVVPSAAAI